MDSSDPQIEKAVVFKSPKRFLADLDATTTGRVIASAADVALIIDDGIVRDIAVSSDSLAKDFGEDGWRGRAWIDTVTVESKPKIKALLETVNGASHWRQVNHPSRGGADVPIRYTTIPTGAKGRMVALGRDLRTISALQQRLVEAHQELERDYSRLREVETRYRLIFDAVSDGMVIVDAVTFEIEEANSAAARIFGDNAVVGASFRDIIAKQSRKTFDRLVVDSLSVGAAEAVDIGFDGNLSTPSLSSIAFRQDAATRLIFRAPLISDDEALRRRSAVLDALERLPDGLVVANAAMEISAANPAFAEMTGMTGAAQIVGRRLSNYLCRNPTDFNVLISNLKGHGFVRNYATLMRDRTGSSEEIEISAVASPSEDGVIYGFSVRGTARRLKTDPHLSKKLPNSVDQLTGLVGRKSLKDIVRESTDLIEKLCIEAALEMTGDNRASAAEMLGVSRQALYTKLRRFGIDEAQ